MYLKLKKLLETRSPQHSSASRLTPAGQKQHKEHFDTASTVPRSQSNQEFVGCAGKSPIHTSWGVLPPPRFPVHGPTNDGDEGEPAQY